MNRLHDMSTVITGAGSGLGRALVDAFVAEGASVVAFDKSQEKLDKLEADLGDAVRTVAGDVTSFADNATACDAAVEWRGKLDTFVGNAGLWDFNRTLADTDPEQLNSGFDELFGVNVKGYLLGAKAALPHLKSSNGSMIVSLSNCAFYPAGGGPLYVASKHAGVGLVKQLAYEFAPEVRVNAVAPGGMASDLRGPASMGLAASPIGDVIPIEQLVKAHGALHLDIRPENYVGPYILLAARNESATTTGTVIDVSSFGIPARP
ncbi:3-(cis-5,6-dihydroxycyclohexa-1,3-dien-1-yl)propanoate dehydrogenase [Rhodococcus sp. 05-340-1]|uniref:3-(cis-5,6-dihydroxycyclohexa-1, 3-dien-1-yl)propanoate dehydrogenase n=1 Tax=unclassified Rhodococcus (in: high G+C Gram-positive bacteria) TaxID=192944 RepID=UPI000B9BFE99|nr:MULTISPECIES: 3-(cis-5,6-dihydroxycyclohexa-1,3-dien-1-yl)propanoate dehydrogenase [unclassified Rhodococcus (in: high G+C Gram-positive bacteria)]OZD68867.1 3-(cis-5,6-dihydroxycyclohexa-1,3-dien-1-yl)propanoate dehydrogenase [Rhodococcus sp. 05-340-2]OZD69340.1 3-(cis-5,6-dihydroxycyclohexa-1,3-dien-1-yl)propanoate dehydrogenase [Rhodococcus sp. 05-340-1]